MGEAADYQDMARTVTTCSMIEAKYTNEAQ
jgi:hypothetical protein